MSQLRKYYLSGNVCFATVVTYDRAPILIENIDLLLNAFSNIAHKLPFQENRIVKTAPFLYFHPANRGLDLLVLLLTYFATFRTVNLRRKAHP